MSYLFAHGTLRQGGRDNGLIKDAVPAGRAVTQQEYALFIVRDKPVVTKRPAATIKGEVFSVTDETLRLTDKLEGHPHINKRELVPVTLEDGTAVEAWLYFHVQPLRSSVLVESGEYTGLKS